MSELLRFRRWSGLLYLLLLAAAPAVAQRSAGFGDWQLYLPNNRARALADAGGRIYVATKDALFFYDKDLNTTQLLSRRDGLNDVGVNTLAYDPLTKQTLLAYKNGNLDVLRADGSIRNISDILRKQATGVKSIRHIYINNRLAYLSSNFGLVVLDLTKLEVRDTYGNIGPNGTTVRVNSTTILHDSLYAATSYGLMRGKLTDNLLDYRKWTTDVLAGQYDPFLALATQDGKVYAGVNGGNLLVFRGSKLGWQPILNTRVNEVRQLTPSAAGLLIADNEKVSILKNGVFTRLTSLAQTPNPQAALQDAATGTFYIADFQKGLVKTTNGQQIENFVTNAPDSARAFSVLANARTNTVDIFSGGYFDRYVQQDYFGGFYEYKDGRWTNFTANNYPSRTDYPNIKDLSRGVRTPDGTLYMATYGDGLLQWKGPGQFKLFTQGTPGTPLLSALPANPGYTRTTDVATDAAGNVWVVNRHQRGGLPGLYIYSPSANTWRSTAYFAGSENLDRLALDDNGYAWVSQARLGGSGLVCYDDKAKTARYFGTSNGLPSGEIYDVVKDRKGDIWVATGKGVAYFSDPSQAFLPGSPGNFQAPIVRRGITYGFAALRDEVVHAIAVDGGNRKWFGTDRGLWLFSDDASESLLNFTTDNSPLPSNNIVDIDINDRTGEVFVVTTGGVVGYRGSATVTEGTAVSCAKVSPNPVRTDFAGEVGISGLANNGYVKITDVTGKLVYQTRPSGGTVIWNLTDYNGRKVQSGVYLVLSSDADGKNGCISKVAVVAK